MHEDLMEQVVSEENLDRALRAVKRKRGAAGTGKMSTAKLEPHFRRHGAEIRAKLASGRWTPSPPSSGQSQAGRDTQAGRGEAAARDTDGDGPAGAASVAASITVDL